MSRIRPHESISIMAENKESLSYFQDVMRTSACFRGKLKNSRRYHSSKNKKIRDRVDSRVQLIWKLRVMGSWFYLVLPVSKTRNIQINQLTIVARVEYTVNIHRQLVITTNRQEHAFSVPKVDTATRVPITENSADLIEGLVLTN